MPVTILRIFVRFLLLSQHCYRQFGSYATSHIVLLQIKSILAPTELMIFMPGLCNYLVSPLPPTPSVHYTPPCIGLPIFIPLLQCTLLPVSISSPSLPLALHCILHLHIPLSFSFIIFSLVICPPISHPLDSSANQFFLTCIHLKLKIDTYSWSHSAGQTPSLEKGNRFWVETLFPLHLSLTSSCFTLFPRLFLPVISCLFHPSDEGF